MALDPRLMANRGWNESWLRQETPAGLWSSAPPAIASFDIESTGIGAAEPISFGMSIFRHGKHSPSEDQHFLIYPKDTSMQEEAYKTHGWKMSDLQRSNSGASIEPSSPGFSWEVPITGLRQHIEDEESRAKRRGEKLPFEKRHVISAPFTRDGQDFVTIRSSRTPPPLEPEDSELPPALDAKTGINKIVSSMANLQKQGFVFIGANQKNFDIPMIIDTWHRHNSPLPIQSTGLLPRNMRIVDVLQHERDIDRYLKQGGVEYERGDPRRPSYSLTNIAYRRGIRPGGHRALSDSITTGEVFMHQIGEVEKRLSEGGPNIRRSFKSSSSLGINFAAGEPHNDKAPCRWCKHLDEVMAEHHAKEDLDSVAAVQGIKDFHIGPTKK